MVPGKGAGEGCRRAEYDSWHHPAAPSGKLLPPPHFCSKKRGERKSHYHTRLLSQCLPQSRGDDVIGNHPVKADGTFNTGHKRGTELGQEESHCSSTCCLVSRTHNKWLVGSKGEKKLGFSKLFRKKVSSITAIKAVNRIKTTVFLKLLIATENVVF